MKPFEGTHPQIIQEWLTEYAENQFTPDPNYQLSKRERRHRKLMAVEKLFGRHLDKKHFKLVSNDQ